MLPQKKEKAISEWPVRPTTDFHEKQESSGYNGIISWKCSEKIIVNLEVILSSHITPDWDQKKKKIFSDAEG